MPDQEWTHTLRIAAATSLKVTVDHWLPLLGTAAPSIGVSDACADWYEALPEHEQRFVRNYIRDEARKHGHVMEPHLHRNSTGVRLLSQHTDARLLS